MFALFPNALLATQISRPRSLMGFHLFNLLNILASSSLAIMELFKRFLGHHVFLFVLLMPEVGFGVGCLYLLIFSMFLCGFFLFSLVGWKNHELAVSILFTCQRWNWVSRKYQGVGVFSGMGVFS